MKYLKGNYFSRLLMVLIIIFVDSPWIYCQNHEHSSWQLGDLKKDKVMGISAGLAYHELLQGRTGIPIIVAVIDGGVDTMHSELSPVIWRNDSEIPGNGKDDDQNGYIDDIHGWNFLGSSKGSFQQDNYDLIRQLRKSTKGTNEAKQLLASVDASRRKVQQEIKETRATIEAFETIISGIGKPNPTVVDLRNYRYHDYAQEQILIKIVAALRQKPDLEAYRNHLQSQLNRALDELNYSLNIDYNPRRGKAFENPYNGNGDVQGAWVLHGSHVAGIIAGRSVGVARNNVELMILRTIPTGDYLDIDMARAIRYAADNGAKIINISAGKSGSTDLELIESAVRYAMDKDVLIIHACGNNGEFLTQGYYPRATYRQGGKAKSWIEVGGSSYANDSTLILKASNYGKAVVDIFAPGLNIRSCSSGNTYSERSGTSMASAVVSGIAAVLRSYYPGFSAEKVRELILTSVNRVDYNVLSPKGIMIPFTEICGSSGIANLYLALEQAEKLKD